MFTSHPNAEISVYTGAATVLVVYVVSLFGLEPPAEVASAFTLLCTGIVLALGRKRRK